jgi:two-component system phosphate regulon sensor histidine kinase PhoR
MKRAMFTRGMLAVCAALALLCTVSSVILFQSGQAKWIWVLVSFTLIILVLSLVYLVAASDSLEKRLLKSVKMVVLSLKGIAGGSYITAATDPLYAQLTPEITEMNTLTLNISDKLRELTAERDRIVATLDNMSEGLVVLEISLNITLINKSAMEFFGVKEELKGQNILRLTHMPKTIEAARKAVRSGKHTAVDIKSAKDDRILQIFINPIHGDEQNLQSGAIMLVTDVTGVRRAEQIRSDFVANASHELKTPLTSIKGFTELIESGIISDSEKISRYLALIRQETERMIELINDILKLSELEAIVSDSGRAQISLKLIAQKITESLALQAQAKDVNIVVSGDMGMLTANPDRMTEVMLNLVDNAVKYNNPGGRVEVHITQGVETVILTVSDTGMGIPEDSQERIFERFYRVDRGRSRKQGGTGLGLAIVKHITELYKGTIALESKLGKGTTIKITLPIK